jgi:tRNA (guanosine-2'-O-)-methyltransferase
LNSSTKKELITYLAEFVTPGRYERLQEVLNYRTRAITVVLEDLYQPHNASAVLRSCDGFGVQDIHIIENRNKFNVSHGVTIGADQWLTLNRYGNGQIEDHYYTKQCLSNLKEQGYRLVATTPHEDDVTIDQLSIDNNVALLFGAEYEGLTNTAMEWADEYARIPMVGFSESFNISVSAALVLYELTRRIRTEREDWSLSEGEKTDLMLQWLKQSVRASNKLIQKYLAEREQQ